MAAALRITPKEYRAIAVKPVKRGRFPVVPREQRCVDGIVFDSKKEAARYAELRLLERAGDISGLIRQFQLNALCAGRHLCSLTVDFKYYHNRTARLVLEEVKSSGTKTDPYYRLRKKAVEITNCVTITEVVR